MPNTTWSGRLKPPLPYDCVVMCAYREVRGESVLSVIMSARLAELERLLRETDDSIESITRRLGWTSPNYQKTLFKKRFGTSMRKFRARS